MEEKLLNIAEVARYLNLSEKAVKELVEQGDLPAYKIGGDLLRFKREQVENYRKIRESSAFATKTLSQAKEADSKFKTIDADKERLWIGRSNALGPGKVKYTFLEWLEDFLYYNDFYILSLILLVLIILAIFGF